MNSYNTGIILGTLMLVYWLSYWKLGKTNAVVFKKIWNWILLVTFLGSGILGLIMAILIDNGINTDWYRQMLWVHVEFGIIVVIVGIIHAWWHARYYLKL